VPSLTVDGIAEKAIDIADRNGLSAVTMETVARALGCTKMALYRYLGGKDDLVAVMFDTGVGQPPPPAAHPESADEGLRTWARALLDRYLAHPWAVDVPLGAAVLTRNRVLWLESALTALADVPLPLQEKLDLVLLLNGHVVFTAKLARDAATGGDTTADLALAEALASADLPQVAAVLRAGHLSDGDARTSGEPTSFERGLDYVLAGVAATVRRRAQPASRARRGRDSGPPRA
jgi:AcrR family transcriptional regulator